MLIQELRSRIYYITPDHDPGPGRLRALVSAALNAGVGMVQLRPAGPSTRDMIAEATALVRMTRAAHTPLVIRSRVDVALAIGADGVHLAADDMPVAYARRLLGPVAIVGAATATPEDARTAERDGATYVTVGAMYPLAAEPGGIVLGLEGLQRVRAATALPICAVGGVCADNLCELVHSGAEVLAVSSAIHGQPEPAAAARDLVKLASSLPAPNHRGV